jgi:hypothetical protein
MDCTEMYRLELGIDPSNREQLLKAVAKDFRAAIRGDQAADRRLAAIPIEAKEDAINES